MTPDADQLVVQLRRRERWLLALAAVRTELLSGGSVQEALTLIAERCAALVDADAVMVLLADEQHQLTVWAASGPLADLPYGPGVGAVIDVDDAWAQALHGELRGAAAADFPAPSDAQLSAVWRAAGPVLVAPIPVKGGPDGVLLCLRRRGREAFDPESQPEVVGLAEQSSLALEVADRAKRERAVELMADRERIARDLHDHVIQRLFAVGLSLQSQVGKIADPGVRGRVDDAVGQIDEAISDVRSSIFDLRASGGASRKTLRRRLADIAAVAARGDSGPRVTVRLRGPIDTVVGAPLADDVEAVVREAVSNAVRHAEADGVAVTVTAGADLAIVVADDGRGIPEGAARSGLKNLAQRAAVHGGTFEVVSTGGTTLRWTVPLG